MFCKVCLQINKVNSKITCPQCKETSVFNTDDLTDFTYQKTAILHNEIKLLDEHSYKTKHELLQKALRRLGTKRCVCCRQKIRKEATKFQCTVCNVAQYCSKKCRSNNTEEHKAFCETLQLQEELYIKGAEYLTSNSEPLVLFLYIFKRGTSLITERVKLQIFYNEFPKKFCVKISFNNKRKFEIEDFMSVTVSVREDVKCKFEMKLATCK